MDIGPALRGQIDYVFCLKEPIIANRKKLHTFFFGIFDRFEDFSSVMDAVTNNHGVLVLDNTQPGNKITDAISYYKANPGLSKFRIGRDAYWRLDKMYRKPDVPMQSKPTRVKRRAPQKMRIACVQKESDDEDDESDENV
jgi:hypothetical protein